MKNTDARVASNGTHQIDVDQLRCGKLVAPEFGRSD